MEPAHYMTGEAADDRRDSLVRIIDDESSIRESFCYLLEGEGWRAKAYASAEEFLEDDDTEVPGCVVLDVCMPGGMTGLELQNELLRLSAGLPLIFVSAHGTIEMAVRAVQKGACDFIPKPIDEEKLLAAIERAVRRCHEMYQATVGMKAAEDRWNGLSAREKEVAMCLSVGMPNKVAADRLGITKRTIQVHRATIYLKLGVRSAAEIAGLVNRLPEAVKSRLKAERLGTA